MGVGEALSLFIRYHLAFEDLEENTMRNGKLMAWPRVLAGQRVSTYVMGGIQSERKMWL